MDLTLSLGKWELMSKQQRRDTLMAFEQACKYAEPTDGITIEPVHHFCDGIYAREITIPKGTALVGEIHLHDQINVVSQGSIRVATEEGVRTITAPCTFISPAGTKRAGFALEDTVWTVFHKTDSTSQQDIRKQFIAPNYEELDKQLENRKCLGLQQQ